MGQAQAETQVRAFAQPQPQMQPGGNGTGHRTDRAADFLAARLAAAKAGRADAYFELGMAYAAGSRGLEPDYVAAHKWFNLAAMRGVRDAVAERAELARDMTPVEIAAAQRAAREWLAAHR